MTALEIKAIKKLPEEYVQDGTFVAELLKSGTMVAMNANLPTIIFKPEDDEWRPLQ